MAITQIKGSNIEDGTVVAADIKDDSITNVKVKSDAAIATTKISGLAASATTDTTDASNISSGTLPTARLASALDLSGKTVTLPAAAVTAHAQTPTLDSPVITGTLSVLDSGNVTHTIANWSDQLSYTITPTNCTAGAVNASGQFVITHTSGNPSYTIKATTDSLGLADSALVTKNITMTLSAPTLSSPANVGTATDVVYTITSTSADDDKLILDPGTANFTYQSESGPGTASKVGNTVECVGFGTGNPVVTIQFTAEATYSVTAKAVKIDGTFGTSANSSADSITIANSYDLEYLVVAGGGGGGGAYGGGGGAGGYRTNYGGTPISTAAGIVYTATVGSGGNGGTGNAAVGTSGGTSSLSGTGISTINTTGGGRGGGYSVSTSSGVESGGSGGGGGLSSSGSAGTAGASGNAGGYTPSEGNAGGAGANGGSWGMGGGGGHNAVGADGTTTNGGNGGAGTSNSITGSSVPYAGGGGGGIETAGTGGSGGTGGGGNAPVANTSQNQSGVNGTGGGGGGSDGHSSSHYGGDAGDGIVILRVPTSGYSGTYTNATITTTGSDTIIKFLVTGTYTS